MDYTVKVDDDQVSELVRMSLAESLEMKLRGGDKDDNHERAMIASLILTHEYYSTAEQHEQLMSELMDDMLSSDLANARTSEPGTQYVKCPCTAFEHDDEIPVGQPSPYCGVCGGTGDTTQEMIDELAAEMLKIADIVGEIEDPFAAWESISDQMFPVVDCSDCERHDLVDDTDNHTTITVEADDDMVSTLASKGMEYMFVLEALGHPSLEDLLRWVREGRQNDELLAALGS